jgi:hypothetical protein
MLISATPRNSLVRSRAITPWSAAKQVRRVSRVAPVMPKDSMAALRAAAAVTYTT